MDYAEQVLQRRSVITLGPPVRFVAVGNRLGVLPGTIGYLRTDAPVDNVYLRPGSGGLIASVACQHCEASHA